MKAKPLLLLCVLLLVWAGAATAQPTCFARYPISTSCPVADEDIILEGRVLSVFELRPDDEGRLQPKEVAATHGASWRKAIVAVELLFKGDVAGQVEITLNGTCWGPIEKGQQYVFNIKRTKEGLYANHWSDRLDDMPPADVAQFLGLIRSLVEGKRQARLSGKLTRAGDPAGRPINAVSSIPVVAEKDGQKFETRTNANGHYEFRKLPDGDYKVYPLLPPSLRPPDDDSRQPREQYDNRTTVANQGLCGSRVDFLTWDNGVIEGRVEDADGKPVNFVSMNLWWLVDKNRLQGAPYPFEEVMGKPVGSFAFVNLAPGPYLVQVNVDEGKEIGTYYYPGVRSEETARVIDLAPGQKATDLVIKLPR